MIGRREEARWTRRFGVAVEQVRRDHLVSHVLAALPELGVEPVMFIGGTALTRTYLDGLRVSEDVDLLVSDPRPVADQLSARLPRLLRRHYPHLQVRPPSRAARGLNLWLEAPEVAVVQLQIIRIEGGEARLDYQSRAVALRYEDLPTTVELTVPTLESFAAMKLATYRERHEPRDLFDLAHLADRGAVTPRAAGFLRQLTGSPPHPVEFRTLPQRTREAWQDRLAHQTGQLIEAEDALARVRQAIERLHRDAGHG